MIEIKMPEAGFSITEGTVVEWHKKIGDKVQAGENIVTVETDKITVDIPAVDSGVLHEIRYQVGEVAPVGDVMGIIAEEGEEVSEITKTKYEEKNKEEKVPLRLDSEVAFRGTEVRKISPAAKAVAKAKGVDLSQIPKGSGPMGRIVKKDVLEFSEKKEIAQVEIEGPRGLEPGEVKPLGVKPHGVEPGGLEPGGVIEPAIKGKKVGFTGWRKVIADRVLSSSLEVPQCTMSIEADVTELSQTITSIRQKEDGLHVTYIPFMMKAMVVGIDQVPEVNAYCDKDGFTVQEEINIGIAVELGEKLIVPVVKNVREKSILELVEEIQEVVEKARNDRLEHRDVEGGTITLTNVGAYQIHSATALILQPQTSIVNMCAAREVPGVWKGNIEIRKRMIFGLTYDHRVINGARTARFLMKVKSCLEDLVMLLMRLR